MANPSLTQRKAHEKKNVERKSLLSTKSDRGEGAETSYDVIHVLPVDAIEEKKKSAKSGSLFSRRNTPIWNRKLDLLYMVFFLVHVPVMLCTLISSS